MRGTVALVLIITGCGSEQRAPDPATTTARIVERLPPARDARVDPEAYRACSTVDSLLRRVPATVTKSLPAVPFDSLWPGDAQRWGCRVVAAGRMTKDWLAIDSLTVWFKARGWSDQSGISADGPDGTVFGLLRAGVTCVVEGRWDGGDDSDTTYVPSDTLELHFGCTRTVPADSLHAP